MGRAEPDLALGLGEEDLLPEREGPALADVDRGRSALDHLVHHARSDRLVVRHKPVDGRGLIWFHRVLDPAAIDGKGLSKLNILGISPSGKGGYSREGLGS